MKELRAGAQRSGGARRKATPLIAYPVPTLDQQLLTTDRDWPQLANHAGYSVSALARTCNVSVRTLERHFLSALEDTPRRWLKRLRMQRAVELLRGGSNVKETANCLGYRYPTHFSAKFKRVHGVPPRAYANISTERWQTASGCRVSI